MVPGKRLGIDTALVLCCLVLLTWASEHRGLHAQTFQKTEFRKFKPRTRKGRVRKTISRRAATYQKIKRTPEGYSVEYGFKNFNGDILKVRAKFSAEDVAASIREFGFKMSEFDKLDRWYSKARKLAITQTNKFLKAGHYRTQGAAATASHNAQKSLDREFDQLAKSYRARRVKIYKKAGFKFKSKGVIEADIPAMVRRNWKRMRPIAQSFSKIASKKRYKTENLVGAVAAMAQTSLRYEIPATKEGTRTIGGLLPPLKSLVLGQGDCDTKTAVISSILMNWPNVKMVGLGIPGHYLMAYQRIPRRGDVFIKYKGLAYVMIESAGPAWLNPGTVGKFTLSYLRSGRNFRIQPM